MQPDEQSRLEAYHRREAVRRRMRSEGGTNHLRDAILGAIDGAITTFAVVAGSVGGGFSSTVVIVLGVASLLADGLSMAVSNYLGAKSDRERLAQARRNEERHIEVVPDRQRDEVRQIFAAKGFSGDTLERIVVTITRDRRLWVDTVVNEEFGLQLSPPRPLLAGLTTFLAFLLVGALPLLPFLVNRLDLQTAFSLSIAITATAFFVVGFVKGRLVGASTWRGGVETLATGGAAAVLAFVAGHILRNWVGV